MPSELERRLEGLLLEAPEPEPRVEEEALRRALAALALRPTQRPRAWAAGLALAAAVVLLAVAAGALAAAGALHVSLGSRKTQTTTTVRTLTLPAGAHGIAAVIDGRLSVVTKSGFRLQGLSVSAAALSPHALYVAAGISHSLVALAPSGQRAWSEPVDGTVTAIAWAPDGLRIAYIVQKAGRPEGALHVIWGNGTHDTVIDRSVRNVQPSWRADSLAFAYTGAGGKAVVYDLAHRSRRLVSRSADIAPVTQLAFSTSGAQLALAGKHGYLVAFRAGRAFVSHTPVAGIGWAGDEPAIVERGRRAALRIDPQSNAIAPVPLGGRAVGFATDGYRFVITLKNQDATKVLAGVGTTKLQPVLELPRDATVRNLSVVR